MNDDVTHENVVDDHDEYNTGGNVGSGHLKMHIVCDVKVAALETFCRLRKSNPFQQFHIR